MGPGGVEVRSAGTRATAGRPVHPWTEAALRHRRVPTAGFESRRLTGDDLDWAGLVLTMTAGHREEVLAVRPRALRKVFTLREAAALALSLPVGRLNGTSPGDRAARLAEVLVEARALHRGATRDLDIPDPIDRPAEAHVTAVEQVAEALVPLVAVLDARPVTDDTVRLPRLPPVPVRA